LKPTIKRTKSNKWLPRSTRDGSFIKEGGIPPLPRAVSLTYESILTYKRDTGAAVSSPTHPPSVCDQCFLQAEGFLLDSEPGPGLIDGTQHAKHAGC
jgi:hypothetical protein